MRLLALAYSGVMPGPRSITEFERAYDCFVALVAKAGLEPTHFAFGNIEDDQSEKLRRWESPAHKRALQVGFERVDDISVICAPRAAKFLDSEAELNLTYSHPRISDEVDEADVETELVMVVELPTWVKLRETHPEVLKELASLSRWDFGYGHIADRDDDPAAHIIGGGNGRQRAEESRRLDAWYDASKQDRLARLRDVFAYNLLNPKQLGFVLAGGGTLREFIEGELASRLTRVGTDLDLWEVAPDATQQVREELLGTGVLITE